MAALRFGGVFVLVAACGDGVGHEDFLPWFRYESEGELIRALVARFRVYGQTALSWRRKSGACRLIMVSDLDPDLVRRLGAEPAADLEEAYRTARDHLPADARGWLFPEGGKILVRATAEEGSG